MIYFIRHAESRYNRAEEKIKEELGEDYQQTEQYLSAKFDPKYYDVEITEEGEVQAEKAREEMKNVEVDVVLVSPMRRALHTCDIIFKDHPSKAKIIVEPEFREIMESSNDLGTEI